MKRLFAYTLAPVLLAALLATVPGGTAAAASHGVEREDMKDAKEKMEDAADMESMPADKKMEMDADMKADDMKPDDMTPDDMKPGMDDKKMPPDDAATDGGN